MKTRDYGMSEGEHGMSNAQEYRDLLSWLHRYGNGAVHWTVFADLDLTQQASGALTDLHSLLRNSSDEEILEFFDKARSDRWSTVKIDMDNPEDRLLTPWANPTD